MIRYIQRVNVQEIFMGTALFGACLKSVDLLKTVALKTYQTVITEAGCGNRASFLANINPNFDFSTESDNYYNYFCGKTPGPCFRLDSSFLADEMNDDIIMYNGKSFYCSLLEMDKSAGRFYQETLAKSALLIGLPIVVLATFVFTFYSYQNAFSRPLGERRVRQLPIDYNSSDSD